MRAGEWGPKAQGLLPQTPGGRPWWTFGPRGKELVWTGHGQCRPPAASPASSWARTERAAGVTEASTEEAGPWGRSAPPRGWGPGQARQESRRWTEGGTQGSTRTPEALWCHLPLSLHTSQAPALSASWTPARQGQLLAQLCLGPCALQGARSPSSPKQPPHEEQEEPARHSTSDEASRRGQRPVWGNRVLSGSLPWARVWTALSHRGSRQDQPLGRGGGVCLDVRCDAGSCPGGGSGDGLRSLRAACVSGAALGPGRSGKSPAASPPRRLQRRVDLSAAKAHRFGT